MKNLTNNLYIFISFNPHKGPKRQVSLVPPFYRGGQITYPRSPLTVWHSRKSNQGCWSWHPFCYLPCLQRAGLCCCPSPHHHVVHLKSQESQPQRTGYLGLTASSEGFAVMDFCFRKLPNSVSLPFAVHFCHSEKRTVASAHLKTRGNWLKNLSYSSLVQSVHHSIFREMFCAARRRRKNNKLKRY